MLLGHCRAFQSFRDICSLDSYRFEIPSDRPESFQSLQTAKDIDFEVLKADLLRLLACAEII